MITSVLYAIYVTLLHEVQYTDIILFVCCNVDMKSKGNCKTESVIQSFCFGSIEPAGQNTRCEGQFPESSGVPSSFLQSCATTALVSPAVRLPSTTAAPMADNWFRHSDRWCGNTTIPTTADATLSAGWRASNCMGKPVSNSSLWCRRGIGCVFFFLNTTKIVKLYKRFQNQAVCVCVCV